MSKNRWLCLAVVVLGILISSRSTHAAQDVLHYAATLEPDIAGKSVKGTVRIRFSTDSQQAEFNCGDLTIDTVRHEGNSAQVLRKRPSPQRFFAITNHTRAGDRDRHFMVHLDTAFDSFRIDNRSTRSFQPASGWSASTIRLTKQHLTFKLILPANLTPIANGKLVSETKLPNNNRVSEWEQKTPIPTYIFGFTAGPFHVVKEKHGNIEFQYFATNFTEAEVRRIFRDTPDMLNFFEDRAGIKYSDKTYTQVLAAGNVAQEMSSFTALRENYGKQVLANEQDQWLGAHEFAHQWWGNMVTCVDWKHFWLNEGIATFIAAAYLEHRFGRAAYMREIESNRANYEKVRAAGKDKSLVFPDWDHPTSEDRTLVYDKGAYVLHLLREEMGERAFWNGLRLFTRRHFGKSVVTTDFLTAMEEANGKSLKEFFAKWVYL